MFKKIFFSIFAVQMLLAHSALAFGFFFGGHRATYAPTPFNPVARYQAAEAMQTRALIAQANATTAAIAAESIPQHRFMSVHTPRGVMTFKCHKRPGHNAHMTVRMPALAGKKRFPVANCSAVVMNAVKSQTAVLLAGFQSEAQSVAAKTAAAVAATTVASASFGRHYAGGPSEEGEAFVGETGN